MAWTTPSTWVSGAILTASQLNTQLRDNLDAIGGAWTAYTPTWTNLTVGNGTNDSAYIKAGRFVVARIKFTLGSTSSVGTIPEFSLPATAKSSSYTNTTVLGNATLYDISGDAAHWGKIIPNTGLTNGRVFVDLVSGTYNIPAIVSATVPFTWAVNDRIEAQLIYEAAS